MTKPLDTAIYWIEYVVRHGGAPHLRVAGTDLVWYQYFLLDVILIVLVLSVVVFGITLILVKRLWSSCKNKKEKIKIN